MVRVISEAEKYDKALVESWRGDMDGMLIFAGLFSASLTAFIIESYKTLTPDSGDTTAVLLAQISNQLAASASGMAFQVPPSAVFAVPATSVICNVLWFISLGLSLSCALIATFVEQWARDFMRKTDMRPSPVIRARIFSYLYYGVKRFDMHMMVDLVPLLLHMSLVLFFAGLVAFLLPINRAVMAVAAALLGIVVAVYCTLTLLPLIYVDCPYRTPFSTVLWRITQLWRRISGLAATGFGRPREGVGRMAEETMVEVMITQATKPSAERDQRDQRSLCWTMKSLVDGTELDPFIAGIPDVLWGPEGRKYTRDHLIRTLLDDPDVRLGDRLLDLMRHSDSALLAPDVAVRYKNSCVRALWSICTLSERGTPLNLPLHGLVHQLAYWSQPPSPSNTKTPEDRDPLANHLYTLQAVLDWCTLCSFDVVFQDVKSAIQNCEADVEPQYLDALRSGLNRLLSLSQVFSRIFHNFEVGVHHKNSGLINEYNVSELSAAPSVFLDSLPWLQKVRSFINDSENYWDDARHTILCGFLEEALSKPDHPERLYEFDSTVGILQFQLSPPSALHIQNYAGLLEMIGRFDGLDEDPWRRHNTGVMVIVMSAFFSISTTPRPPMNFDSIDTLISYIGKHLYHDQALSFVLNDTTCNITELWAAITNYLSYGCPRSNTTEATLEVICGLYHWLRPTRKLSYLGMSDPCVSRDSGPWFNEYTLSTIQGLPQAVCPPYHSVLVMVKIRMLISLGYRHYEISEHLFNWSFSDLKLIESPSAILNSLIPPTQSDWAETKSFFSHALLSESTLGDVLRPDPNFDLDVCDGDAERAAQHLNLLTIVSTRFIDAQALSYAEFLEACSSQTLPYKALDTLTRNIALPAPGFSVLLAHTTHRNRFANSIQALMKARATTPEHTELWEHLLEESSILGGALKPVEPFPGILYADSEYEPSAVLVIKGALEEYAESIRGLSDAETTINKRLKDLDALLKTVIVDPPTAPGE
ncbi:hypothetical protein B0H17DRAFT_1141254 [Mycena rosella]|uniref:DUF6535 domain-containing protein n=1 Tax=Mycena rosella TaxID=1033263 RepID=A0AAD7D027_MYCRO|nr:hypothetical protein B0H17DRAFT_1141254 [Mycena rosella]